MDLKRVFDNCKVILLDIEGTTTSISFVKDVLFPFVRSHIRDYLETRWNEPEVQDDIAELRKQIEEDRSKGLSVPIEIPVVSDVNEVKSKTIEYVNSQMDLDRKTTALKQLQGHIWKQAYVEGKISGHVYDDVPRFFQFCTQRNKKIFIYSSGSVEAQKLLFGYSKFGDQLNYISGHFDTNVGAKIESSSYVEIAKRIECDPNQIIFFTDIPKEAEAAEKGKINVVLVERDGNFPLTKDEMEMYRRISSFDQISISS